MRDLSIDIETYSNTNLSDCGVYKYVEDPSFRILLFSFSYDEGNIACIDLARGQKIPASVLYDLVNPNVRKHAHNAAFERICIQAYFWDEFEELPIEQWYCTMVLCATTGLPLNLGKAAIVLKLEDGKDKEGKALIKYFCEPCKPTKVNGMRTRNLPHHAPDKWMRFIQYCMQDVRVEQAIAKKLYFNPQSIFERELWVIDQRINDRGVMLNPDICRIAIDTNMLFTADLSARAIEITGVSNPNSLAQLKDWLTEAAGRPVEKLTAEIVTDMLKVETDPAIRELLSIRQSMGKTSIGKYAALLDYMCTDGRVKGMFQFAGAGRTWRWAGRGPQLHNLPKNEMELLAMAREMLLENDAEYLHVFFNDISYVLSQLIRTALVPKPGHRFIVADFSQFEARILAWLAGERWRLNVFSTHGKIYEASASQMFKIPIEKITKGSDARFKGKLCELLLGYGGGPGAMIKAGVLKKGVKEKELPVLVKMWRNANKMITTLWDDVGLAAILAVEGHPQTLHHGLRFFVKNNILWITLPSGRNLAYLRPRIVEGKFGGKAIQYEGLSDKKVWGMQDTYGPKLVENIVQAIQRDLLGNAIYQVDKAGYNIVLHVHDELGCEEPFGKGSVEELCQLMMRGVGPQYAGLPLGAEGFETMYYKKE